MEKTLDRWRKDSNARYKWQEFLSTPEFDKKLGQFYADKEMEMLENSQ